MPTYDSVNHSLVVLFTFSGAEDDIDGGYFTPSPESSGSINQPQQVQDPNQQYYEACM